MRNSASSSRNSDRARKPTSKARFMPKALIPTCFCALIAAQPAARVLDLGCGAGHVSLRVAPLVQHVTAYDLLQRRCSPPQNASRRTEFTNVSF